SVGIKRFLDDLRVTAAQLNEFDLLKWDPTRGILLLGQQVESELVALRNFARRYGSRLYTHDGCIKENGNTTPKTTVVEGVEKVIPPTTAEEKARMITRSEGQERALSKACESVGAFRRNDFTRRMWDMQSSKGKQVLQIKESTRRNILVETSTSTALVSCDGLGGYD
ncbi:hypothetical protein Tco_0633903, partial [Tanacetum coccineum]